MIGRRVLGTQKRGSETGLFFDAAFLATGTLSGDNTYTTREILPSAYLGTAGLRLTGRPMRAYNYDWAVRYAEVAKWERQIDLAPYRYLRFAARKVVNHGSILVALDRADPNVSENGLLCIWYSAAPTEWTEYTINITDWQGAHLLAFLGGYVDRTGAAASETQYANIRLVI